MNTFLTRMLAALLMAIFHFFIFASVVLGATGGNCFEFWPGGWVAPHAIANGSLATVDAADGLAGMDGEEEPVPGLRAEYRSQASGASCERVDADVQFDWGDASPDLRIPAGSFAVRWSGTLYIPAASEYRFHLFTAGSARLTVNGKAIIEGEHQAAASWLSSRGVKLEPGHVPIQVEYTRTGSSARIGLYWESGKFGLEPVASRWLFHDRGTNGDPVEFERGEELVRAYRCAACHVVPGIEFDRKAPALDRVASRLQPAWLARWLHDSSPAGSDRRMPSLALTDSESQAIAAFLLGPAAGPSPARSMDRGRVQAGEELFRSIGCMACHTLNGAGNAGLFGGGSVDHVGDKRPAAFFVDWLTKPQSINPAHRMPVFDLKKDEVDDLARFLASLSDGEVENGGALPAAPDAQRELGKQLITSRRCTACHDVASVPADSFAKHVLDDSVDWTNSCLGDPDRSRLRPGYGMSEGDRRAIELFFAQMRREVSKQSGYERGRRLFGELNCAACHARDLARGLEPGRFHDHGGTTDLAKLRGELEPPSLTAVGDKFHDGVLARLVAGGLAPRRPWLKVRMPRFDHTGVEREALLNFLIQHDRIPGPPPPVRSAGSRPAVDARPAGSDRHPPPASLDSVSALVAGHQLVSSRGFGCMSCHTVGKHQPRGVAVNARGSDLLKLGDRIRYEWFQRWVRDPARIVPGMEMPSITMAARGVLDDRLDLQLDALWHALNSPSFVVPSDRETAQQVISLSAEEPPEVLRDVVWDCPPGSGWCARPFAIGLPNRHNLLFDLDTMSLRGWWIGDFARERTEGKTWLWEPGGLAVFDRHSPVPTVALRDVKTNQLSLPAPQGQGIAQLRRWETSSAGGKEATVDFTYELKFESGASLTVSESITQGQAKEHGFVRSVRVRDVPRNFNVLLLVPVPDSAAVDNGMVRHSSPVGNVEIARVTGNGELGDWQLVPQFGGEKGTRVVGLALGASSGECTVSIQYRGPGAASMAPASAAVAAKPRKLHAKTLQLAPGFEFVRLPLDPAVMPTAVTVDSAGTPIVCSLKGQVFRATDSDGDALADTWLRHGGHFAAPFGVLSDEDGLYILHKPELLRFDRSGRSYATAARVVADGWGVTEDYHDWAFGIVRDRQGNKYIGTGSDYTHKGRPDRARKWRGQILKVAPDGTVEELARGARYPTGLAINRDDQLFFTDNQGVQNTFNEINHVVPQSRYGVPSLDDPAPDRDPWPERNAAIQIPHPWTRSINGICFLDGGIWGPFEGHGVGCEYDTRRLIRFSLQRVGNTYQGACYPWTLPEEEVAESDRLLGPICCAVASNGDLYIGGLRDSGWGAGNNIGELVRVRPAGNTPPGIREVRATATGFEIDFTVPVSTTLAADPAKYNISSYRRVWQGTYATPDSDRRTETIQAVRVTGDAKTVVITLDSMRPGFVYDIHVSAILEHGELRPAEAYFTLNRLPD